MRKTEKKTCRVCGKTKARGEMNKNSLGKVILVCLECKNDKTRLCTSCGKQLPVSSFYGHDQRCRACRPRNYVPTSKAVDKANELLRSINSNKEDHPIVVRCAQAILSELAKSPLGVKELRKKVGGRHEFILAALKKLRTEGLIIKKSLREPWKLVKEVEVNDIAETAISSLRDQLAPLAAIIKSIHIEFK